MEKIIPWFTSHLEEVVNALTIFSMVFGSIIWVYKKIWMPAWARIGQYDLEVVKSAEYRKKMDGVLKELMPNGGFSIKDQINSINNNVTKISNKQNAQILLSPNAMFECDSNGNCINVNQKWIELTGMPLQEARGNGWFQTIDIIDRDRIYREWTAGIASNIEIHSSYKLSLNKIEVTVISIIGRTSDGKIDIIMGTVTKNVI